MRKLRGGLIEAAQGLDRAFFHSTVQVRVAEFARCLHDSGGRELMGRNVEDVNSAPC